ncbi:MAG TPA: hypothetical protein VK779_08295 [Rhizomicrobium sp.]|jgi:hypothetical protein|nr:hypothetical protein [Rhizomicrobium sp.]
MESLWERRGPVAAIIVAAFLLIAPLWCVSAPAMPDFPAHLASYYLIGVGNGVSPFYRIEWAFIPNLGAEIAVPFLAHFMALEAAAKLFISLGVAMWVVGPSLIHRALYGRFGFAPLAAAFFAYNANFMWGFINYYFAAGLSLVVFAAWIATDGRRRGWMIPCFAVAATAVYFSHIFASCMLAVMMGCFELSGLLERRDPKDFLRQLISIAIAFVPAGIAFVFLRPHGGSTHRLEFNILSSFMDRVGAMVQWSYDHPALILLLPLAILLAVGIRRRLVTFHPRMTFVLIAFAAGTFFAPEWAMGGWGVELRMPAAFCALVFASAALRLSPKQTAIAVGICLVVMAYCAATLAGNWMYFDRRYSEFRAASTAIPRNAKVVTVLDGIAIGMASDQLYWHMGEFAIIDRNAFTQLMFATPGQHVISARAPYRSFAALSAQQGSPPDISELDDLAAGQVDGDTDIKNIFPYLMHYQCHFDEAVIVDLNGTQSPVPSHLKLRHDGSFFSIYDISHAGCPKR